MFYAQNSVCKNCDTFTKEVNDKMCWSNFAASLSSCDPAQITTSNPGDNTNTNTGGTTTGTNTNGTTLGTTTPPPEIKPNDSVTLVAAQILLSLGIIFGF